MTITDWLSKLIALDTVSSNSNLPLIEMIEPWLNEHHLPYSISKDSSQPKANLFATIPGEKNQYKDGIILSGHTDVVPIKDQHWLTNPFVATEIDNHIYGRGAADMKGFLAVMLYLIPYFKSLKLPHPIHLAFSYDEEIGCLGAPLMIKNFIAEGYKPKACIVGEPSSMRPVVAHKGMQIFNCKVKGHAVHSSLTNKGCNAIHYAAKVIVYLDQFAKKMSEGPLDEHFDVPFTTLTTNLIKGGIARNIVPELCEFDFEFRQLPKVNAKEIIASIEKHVKDEILPEMRSKTPEAEFEFISLGAAPSFESETNTSLYLAAKKILNEQEILKVGYCTEAGYFQEAGISTIICGPGSITEAHRPNEFVSMDQLNRCAEFLQKIVIDF
jgi:acetylornithine deacetylase